MSHSNASKTSKASVRPTGPWSARNVPRNVFCGKLRRKVWKTCGKYASRESRKSATRHDLIMAMPADERFVRGALMFDAARAMVLASLDPELELKRAGDNTHARWSPDGNWVAFASEGDGRRTSTREDSISVLPRSACWQKRGTSNRTAGLLTAST